LGHVLEALKTGFMLGNTTSEAGDFFRKWLEEVTGTIAIRKCLCTIIGVLIFIQENVKHFACNKVIAKISQMIPNTKGNRAGTNLE